MNKRHHDVQARRTQGTGSWLIETVEFRNWLENRSIEECRTLLGLGDPGAGKTFAWYVGMRRYKALDLYAKKLVFDPASTCHY